MTWVGLFRTADVLNVPSLDDAEALVLGSVETLDLFDIRIVPVNHFPHFG